MSVQIISCSEILKQKVFSKYFFIVSLSCLIYQAKLQKLLFAALLFKSVFFSFFSESILIYTRNTKALPRSRGPRINTYSKMPKIVLFLSPVKNNHTHNRNAIVKL
jgi:hypothetical protein